MQVIRACHACHSTSTATSFVRRNGGVLGSSYPRLNGSLIGVTALSAGYRGVSTADDSFARRSPTTRTAASPYREDERTEYIFALTGFPVGLKWQELVALGAVETPDAKLFLYDDQQAQRADVPEIVAERPGKMLVLCDSLDQGCKLATDLDAPFVHGETTDRMRMVSGPRKSRRDWGARR